MPSINYFFHQKLQGHLPAMLVNLPTFSHSWSHSSSNSHIRYYFSSSVDTNRWNDPPRDQVQFHPIQSSHLFIPTIWSQVPESNQARTDLTQSRFSPSSSSSLQGQCKPCSLPAPAVLTSKKRPPCFLLALSVPLYILFSFCLFVFVNTHPRIYFPLIF